MAAEPLSGGGAVGLTIGGASIFGILTNTDFGVVIGAFAGALFVVTQQKEVPVWRMCIHLLVAFVVGVLGAGVAASFMQWLTHYDDKPLDALCAVGVSALSIKALTFLYQQEITSLFGFLTKLRGGGGGNGK
ncbi:TPA: holin [Escherichia coli]|uniref:Membrane protein n=1 Tax=Escherichia coli TaxID=562 RepID=A0A2X7B975_ECOLX|nr:putative holin [Escherichia coli]EFA4306445.1 holin [Escherichia coli O19]MED9733541.1 putative holin [Escherichia marmotae]EET0751742.1 holin [Escherichia coli]EET5103714.1 holin [Escherichia coli]EEU9511493.1 holin [Escherichia coli]